MFLKLWQVFVYYLIQLLKMFVFDSYPFLIIGHVKRFYATTLWEGKICTLNFILLAGNRYSRYCLQFSLVFASEL